MLYRQLILICLLGALCACKGRPDTQDVSSVVVDGDSTVSQLSLSAGSLNPAFDSATTSYTMTLPYGTSTLEVTPTLGNSGAVMTVNGTTVASGSGSGAIAIPTGASTITISITSTDQSTTATYTIAVTRATASTDNNLSGMTISTGVLSPTFNSSTTAYTVQTSDLSSNLTVTPTGSQSGALIEASWNGGAYNAIVSGQSSAVFAEATGTNTLNVRVTSESGVQKTYSVTVTHGLCAAGLYDDGTHACVPVTTGYYSPAANNSRTACTNKPANARYTSPTASSASCPWSCDDGYLTTDGISCNSYPNATVLSCNDDEVATGLYGRSGSIADRLGVRCATFSDGIVGSTVRNGPYYGGTGGAPFSEDCAAGAAAQEIDGDFATYSGAPRTGRLRYRCVDVTSLAYGSWSPSGSYWGSQTGLGAFNYACGSGANPNGNFINGIIVDNAGGAAYVGQILGITCR